MDATVRALIERGVAKSTLTAYESGKRRYLAFCSQFHFTPLPITKDVIFLFSSSLAYQSIRSYLSAVRHLQITSGLPDPALSSFSRLDYALKGVRREGAPKPQRSRMPITPEILHKIHRVWSLQPCNFDRSMLWAAFCLGFFGFMRAGEFTCPSQEAFQSDMLSPGDVCVDSHDHPTRLAIHLKRSKTDPFGAGTTIHLGRTGSVLCPVVAMLNYLAIRPPKLGPLFMFHDGSTLSRPRLVHSLRQVLREVGIDDSQFSGHSFRIGAATTAARVGLNDSFIQTLGRWKSSAYTLYIRTPPQRLTAVSASLVANFRGTE